MKLQSRHLLGLEGMSKDELTLILDTAVSFREILEKHPAVAEAIEKTAQERRGVSGAMEVAEWMGSMLKWTGVVQKK